MHQQVNDPAEVAARKPAAGELVSTEPATGKEIWSGKLGDAAAEVAAARAAWPEWAAHSHAYRIEAMRRFANVVRKKEVEFAELIARETGKPLWESRTEVGAVVNKVDISIDAYAERTPMRRMEAAMGNKIAVRHKPHGVLAVLGPYNFPAHLPNGHIVPALIAGNAVVFKPSEKTPATGELLVRCFHEAGVPEGAGRAGKGARGVLERARGELRLSLRACRCRPADGRGGRGGTDDPASRDATDGPDGRGGWGERGVRRSGARALRRGSCLRSLQPRSALPWRRPWPSSSSPASRSPYLSRATSRRRGRRPRERRRPLPWLSAPLPPP